MQSWGVSSAVDGLQDTAQSRGERCGDDQQVVVRQRCNDASQTIWDAQPYDAEAVIDDDCERSSGKGGAGAGKAGRGLKEQPAAQLPFELADSAAASVEPYRIGLSKAEAPSYVT